jgi:MATH domain
MNIDKRLLCQRARCMLVSHLVAPAMAVPRALHLSAPCGAVPPARWQPLVRFRAPRAAHRIATMRAAAMTSATHRSSAGVRVARRYILVYPQGCDVCNHLSLFLCVADYEKLLPGWNHFAQFTIAVVNSDPKKSKYSGAPTRLLAALQHGLGIRPCSRYARPVRNAWVHGGVRSTWK